MSKHNLAISVLADKVREIGGELYALELVKKQPNGDAMAALLGGLSGSKEHEEQFKELVTTINFLKEDATKSEEIKNA